mgnify:CR=1 FL=1
MSLIIGACKWLRDNKENYDLLYDRRQNNENKKAEPEEDSGLPSWVNNFQNAQKRNYIQNKKELQQKILKAFMRRTAYTFGEKPGEKAKKEDIDEDFINYESENEEEDYFSAKKVMNCRKVFITVFHMKHPFFIDLWADLIQSRDGE